MTQQEKDMLLELACRASGFVGPTVYSGRGDTGTKDDWRRMVLENLTTRLGPFRRVGDNYPLNLGESLDIIVLVLKAIEAKGHEYLKIGSLEIQFRILRDALGTKAA